MAAQDFPGENNGRYAQVVVDVPTRSLDKAFTYSIPTTINEPVLVGSCVLVDFGNRPVVGYVVGLQDELAEDISKTALKPIRRVLDTPYFDKRQADLAFWISAAYAAPLSEAVRLFCPPGGSPRIQKNEEGEWELKPRSTGATGDLWATLEPAAQEFTPARNASKQRSVLTALSEGPMRVADLALDISSPLSTVRSLEKKGVVRVYEKRRIRGVDDVELSSAQTPQRSEEELSQGQKDALSAIYHSLEHDPEVVVLDGVTGSGKTEVYLQAISRVLQAGKGALVLVPEISLTAQTVGRFRARFGDLVAVLHSRLSAGERYDQWDLVRQGIARVVVGARSALFAPLKNPGLIVIDEEHESTYKQSQSPRYHAREVAEKLAQLSGCPLVLGSATPSLETLQRTRPDAEHRIIPWKLISMPERVNKSRSLPPVTVVDMTFEFASNHRSMFSRPLIKALKRVQENKEKAVLLLNRRGFANFLLCRECGHVPTCEHCSTSLTYHQRTGKLSCHTCATDYQYPARCPQCDSPYLRLFGAGTQRVEDELRTLMGPDMPIIRMDADTTRTKGAHEKLLREFDAEETAILLGTQMIAKGLDFPEVTVVGVINADTSLNLPDFRSGERTYALLEQVAGRAGRGEKDGEVIIQTYWPAHHAIQAVRSHNRDIFLQTELEQRRQGYYPPYSRLINIVVWGPKKDQVDKHIALIRSYLEKHLLSSRQANLFDIQADEDSQVRILGPAECIISKQKDMYRRHILVKLPPQTEELEQVFMQIPSKQGIHLSVDVDPYHMM